MRLWSFNCLLCLVLLAGNSLMSGAAEKKPSLPVGPRQVSYSKEEIESARKAVGAFLAELDKEDGRTWEYFAPLARRQTTEKLWQEGIDTLKIICGAVISRAGPRVACYDGLPDAPAGRYFIFEFDSKFERLSLPERIVLLKDGAGWKVAGYFRAKRLP